MDRTALEAELDRLGRKADGHSRRARAILFRLWWNAFVLVSAVVLCIGLDVGRIPLFLLGLWIGFSCPLHSDEKAESMLAMMRDLRGRLPGGIGR